MLDFCSQLLSLYLLLLLFKMNFLDKHNKYVLCQLHIHVCPSYDGSSSMMPKQCIQIMKFSGTESNTMSQNCSLNFPHISGMLFFLGIHITSKGRSVFNSRLYSADKIINRHRANISTKPGPYSNGTCFQFLGAHNCH